MTTIFDIIKKDTAYLVEELAYMSGNTVDETLIDLQELLKQDVIETKTLGEYTFYYKK